MWRSVAVETVFALHLIIAMMDLRSTGVCTSRVTCFLWILEGFLYYLQEARAKETLKCITQNAVSETVVLADFMNESSTHLARELKTHFYFHSDWPEELLPMLGFSHVKVSEIGDPDANFGLINDELNLFHQMRRVSRHVKADVNGKPYMRLLLVES